jgi:hypothetical protein
MQSVVARLREVTDVDKLGIATPCHAPRRPGDDTEVVAAKAVARMERSEIRGR